MNELDRLSFRNNTDEPNDMSAALSQYLAQDGVASSKYSYRPNVEPTHNYLGVAADVGNGFVNEVINHPLNLLATAGEGALAGAALRYAPVPIRAGVVVGSLALGAYEVSQNAPKWIADASTVVNGSTKSAYELAQAHAGLEHFGGGVAELGAGITGIGLGARLPEWRTAIAEPLSAYRSGALSREQLFPEIRDGLKAQSQVKIDWTRDPDWVKPAMEKFGSGMAALPAIGEQALNSPLVQKATGAVRSGVEQVRSFIGNKFTTADSAPADTVSTPVETPPVHAAPSEATAEAITPVVPAAPPEAAIPEAPPVVVHEGVDSQGHPFIVEEEPDHFAVPESEAGHLAESAAADAIERVPGEYIGGVYHAGLDREGRPFSVHEEPDVFDVSDAAQHEPRVAEVPELSDETIQRISALYDEINGLSDSDLQTRLTESIKTDPDRKLAESQLLWEVAATRLNIES